MLLHVLQFPGPLLVFTSLQRAFLVGVSALAAESSTSMADGDHDCVRSLFVMLLLDLAPSAQMLASGQSTQLHCCLAPDTRRLHVVQSIQQHILRSRQIACADCLTIAIPCLACVCVADCVLVFNACRPNTASTQSSLTYNVDLVKAGSLLLHIVG